MKKANYYCQDLEIYQRIVKMQLATRYNKRQMSIAYTRTHLNTKRIRMDVEKWWMTMVVCVRFYFFFITWVKDFFRLVNFFPPILKYIYVVYKKPFSSILVLIEVNNDKKKNTTATATQALTYIKSHLGWQSIDKGWICRMAGDLALRRRSKKTGDRPKKINKNKSVHKIYRWAFV